MGIHIGRETMTEEEKAVIDTVELAVDYGLEVDEEMLEEYNRILRKNGGKQNEERSSNCTKTDTDR